MQGKARHGTARQGRTGSSFSTLVHSSDRPTVVGVGVVVAVVAVVVFVACVPASSAARDTWRFGVHVCVCVRVFFSLHIGADFGLLVHKCWCAATVFSGEYTVLNVTRS